MAAKTDNAPNGFQVLFEDVKEYINLQSEYLQVGLVEKLTKVVSKLIFALVTFVFLVGTLFYLMFAVAYKLEPILGFPASFAIIGGVFVLLLLIVVLFRKQLIINPVLKMLVDVFYEDPNERKTKDEDHAATL